MSMYCSRNGQAMKIYSKMSCKIDFNGEFLVRSRYDEFGSVTCFSRNNCGVKLVQVNGQAIVTPSQADKAEPLPMALHETTIITMGYIAANSSPVEPQVNSH